MSICESTSSQSSDQSSESSASSGISKTSPELRLRPKSTSEKSAHLSCPDLETMVTKNSSQCMTIPNRAIGKTHHALKIYDQFALNTSCF